MQRFLIIIGSIILLIISIWVFAPTNSNDPSTPPVAVTAVEQATANSAVIYDVRTPEEYAEQHVTIAQNFDVERLKAGELPPSEKEATIYVYCRSGNRSAEATSILKQNGYTNVTDLGGLDDLRSAGVL